MGDKINSELDLLFLLFLELYSLSEFTRCSSHILHTFQCVLCFILISYCSIFKDRSPPPFLRQLAHYITICPMLSSVFDKFFCTFSGYFQISANSSQRHKARKRICLCCTKGCPAYLQGNPKRISFILIMEEHNP